MSLNPALNNIPPKNTPTFNWPIVSFLLFMTAIPGIPAIYIIGSIILGTPSEGAVSSMVNPIYFDTPAAVFVHGCSGILFFLTMPFQFSTLLRNKYKKWHKTCGYIAVSSAYIMAISAVWMHLVLTPENMGMRYFSLIVLSTAMCIAFSMALKNIFNKRVAEHKRWMTRAVAITLAAITTLFIELFLYLIFGESEVINQFMHDFDRLLGIVINLAIVEYIFYRAKLNKKINRNYQTETEIQTVN